MRTRLIIAALALVCLPVLAIDTAALKAIAAAKIEQLANQLLPKEKFDRALGFFGPVAKKYLPEFEKFNNEYLSTTNKILVVKKYLPKADAAYAEALQMKVPAKYEKEKAEYLTMARTFLRVTRGVVILSE